MNAKNYNSIGVMSGTSLDGVDLCFVRFNLQDDYSYKILKTKTVPYSEAWKSKLQKAFNTDASDLSSLDIEYGDYLASLIIKFIDENNLEDIDFIASHGHTIFHKPNEGYTLQIGDGKTIASRTNIKVICDFRTQDMKLGGQGAPLVPIGDALLFKDYDFCLNLGGFANVSLTNNANRIAFDICPVNIVLNQYVAKLGLEYDDKGAIAASGNVDTVLLNALNSLEFYFLDYPKSLGLEWVHEYVFPLINKCGLDTPDILRTFVEHIAIQISKVIDKDAAILVTGGGALNEFLMQRLSYYLQDEIVLPDEQLIHFKEALVFAFLGLLKLNNQINVLSSVTGARESHSSGVIFS